MENRESILKTFKEIGKPVRPGESADATTIDKAEVSKILKELKAEGKIISPKRCFYSLP